MQRIAGQQSQTIAVTEDHEPVAEHRFGGGEGFGGGKQLLDIVHPQNAGPLEHGVVHGILDRPGSKIARLEHNHRLDPSGGARGRNELAAIAGIFHVHQDGAGVRIPQQVIQQIAEIHIPTHAHRDHMRETNLVAGRPIE